MNKLLYVFLLLLSCARLLGQAPPTADPDKPRVFITDSQSWEYVSNSGGGGGAFASHGSGGARPQTAEIIKTFGERCPQVVTNNRLEKADYVVVLDHEGGKGVLRHRNKVAVFNHVSGDSVVSKSTLSLGGSVQDACQAITADWSAHAKEIRTAEAGANGTGAPPPQSATANATRTPPGVQSVAARQAVGQGTASAVPNPQVPGGTAAPAPAAASAAQLQIASTPDGADIEIDGGFVGSTPSTVGVVSGQHDISVKKPGFKPWERKITVSSGQVNVNAALEAGVK